MKILKTCTQIRKSLGTPLAQIQKQMIILDFQYFSQSSSYDCSIKKFVQENSNKAAIGNININLIINMASLNLWYGRGRGLELKDESFPFSPNMIKGSSPQW